MSVRLYDPPPGRFLEVDPMEGGSADDYDYCNGDPINCFDLAGTSPLSDFTAYLSGQSRAVRDYFAGLARAEDARRSAANAAVNSYIADRETSFRTPFTGLPMPSSPVDAYIENNRVGRTGPDLP